MNTFYLRLRLVFESFRINFDVVTLDCASQAAGLTLAQSEIVVERS